MMQPEKLPIDLCQTSMDDLCRQMAQSFCQSPWFQHYICEKERFQVCVQEAKILIEHCQSAPHKQHLRDYWQQRLSGVPLARILGYKCFWNSDFVLSAQTLIPRWETEGIIEHALRIFPQDHPRNILDLGTGSGCILLSLLQEFPHAMGVGIDQNLQTLEHSARINGQRLNLDHRVDWHHKSWENPLSFSQKFDLVVSNPPYITQKDMSCLPLEVADHDPLPALWGGYDGLDAYRRIFAQLSGWLVSTGCAIFEIGHDQGDALQDLAKTHHYQGVVFKDYAQKPRYIVCKRAT